MADFCGFAEILFGTSSLLLTPSPTVRVSICPSALRSQCRRCNALKPSFLLRKSLLPPPPVHDPSCLQLWMWGNRKVPAGGASQPRGGITMSRIITASELQNRSLADLQALYRTVQQELTASAPGSAVRRNALASLENISRANTQRRVLSPRF